MRKRGLRKRCRVLNTHGRDGDEGETTNNSVAKDKEKNESPIPDSSRQTILVVATLIATVTFAAGFTLPGGYVSDKGPLEGTAVLRKNIAFQAFLMTDAIALMLSSYVVITQLLLEWDSGFTALILKNSFGAVTLAMIAMVMAFIAGVFAVLEPPNSLLIAILIISILIFFNNAIAFCYLLSREMKNTAYRISLMSIGSYLNCTTIKTRLFGPRNTP